MPLHAVTIILHVWHLGGFSYPGLPLHHWLVQILKESAGLLHGSRSSVAMQSIDS